MAEQTSSQRQLWFNRNGRWLFLGGLLFAAELYVSLRWGVRGTRMIYWWYLLDQFTMITFYVACALSLLAFLAWQRISPLKWQARIGIIALVLLPLPLALFNLRFAPPQYIASKKVHGHVYHLSYYELSGQYFSLHECDSIGMMCYQVDSFSMMSGDSPYNVALLANSDGNTLYIIRNKDTIREYSIVNGELGSGRWLEE